MKRRTVQFAAACVTLAVLVACTEPNRESPNVTVTIEVDSLVMTSPGTARAAVSISDTSGRVYIVGDSLSKSVETTGPFTWAWDVANRAYYRNIVVTATGAGAGTLIVAAEGVADTILLRAEAVSFQSVSVATGFACAVALTGRLWCWGDNRSNQLAAPTPGDCVGSACQYGGGQRAETPVAARTTQTFASVATGGTGCTFGLGIGFVCGETCALTPSGDASCWGYGATTSSPVVLPSKPTRAVVTPTFTASGTPRSCFLLDTGSLYCLGHAISSGGNNEPAGTIGGSLQYTAFDVGRYHACGVRVGGDIYCWGGNTRGNLGIGTIDANAHPDPELVTAPDKFSAVEVADLAACGLSVTGKVYCWGVGYSASGVTPPPACSGPTLCQSTPRLIEGGRTYVQISMSQPNTRVCGLTTSGVVDCWSPGTFNVAPTSPPVPQPLRSISVGDPDSNGYFTATGCGVSTTDVLWCWNSTSVWKVGQ
jgi:hypothetical protein